MIFAPISAPFIVTISTWVICNNILPNMQLHVWEFDDLKNKILQKVSDIKANNFNIALFFNGLLLLGHGEYVKVKIKNIIKKGIYNFVSNFGNEVVKAVIIKKYSILTTKHELKVLQ